MPCSDPGAVSLDLVDLRLKLDHTTALLCVCCQILKEQNIPFPADLARWWMWHERSDKERLEKEEYEKAAADERDRREYERLKAKFKEEERP